MSLHNLVRVSLETVTPSKQTIRRLLEGAARHIADAKVKTVSAETRFGSAYTAIRMLADVGLHAHGYRTLTSKPGHRCDIDQATRQVLGLDVPLSPGISARRLEQISRAQEKVGSDSTFTSLRSLSLAR